VKDELLKDTMLKNQIMLLNPGKSIDEIIQENPELSIPISEIPEVKENYSFNLDSTIMVETNNNFSLQNLKSAKFKELKLVLPADTKINPEDIDTLRIKAQANDGSQPYIVEQFGNFKMTTDSISQKKNLYLSTLDTNRDVIDQLKASGVEYSIYAKFNKSIPVRLKDEFKLIVGYKLTVKK
jgi:hypothetical protein